MNDTPIDRTAIVAALTHALTESAEPASISAMAAARRVLQLDVELDAFVAAKMDVFRA